MHAGIDSTIFALTPFKVYTQIGKVTTVHHLTPVRCDKDAVHDGYPRRKLHGMRIGLTYRRAKFEEFLHVIIFNSSFD